MMLIGWRTWKLRRKAIGSNDAEVQSILEAEDHNFRARLIWSELNGRGQAGHHRTDLVEIAEKQALVVKGILCTDSKGGYDAVETNESPLDCQTCELLSRHFNFVRISDEPEWIFDGWRLIMTSPTPSPRRRRKLAQGSLSS